MSPKLRKRLSPRDTSESIQNASTAKKKKKLEENSPRKIVKVKDTHNKSHSSSPKSKKGNVDKNKRKSLAKKDVKENKEESKEEGVRVEDTSNMNVAQLLALGENCRMMEFENSTMSSGSEDSDFEEVKCSEIKQPDIPKEGVNITVEMPNFKRKSKGFDAEAVIKREMNRVKKGLQLLMHKVHVLCWIAHVKFVNNVLNSSSLMESCIVLIKSKNLYPPKHADLSYLEGILKWFHKTFSINAAQSEPVSDDKSSLLETLMCQIKEKETNSFKNFVLIFIIFLRILGLKVRIVMSFQVLPIRPPASDLFDCKTGRPSTEKTKSTEVTDKSDASKSDTNKSVMETDKKNSKSSNSSKVKNLKKIENTTKANASEEKKMKNSSEKSQNNTISKGSKTGKNKKTTDSEEKFEISSDDDENVFKSLKKNTKKKLNKPSTSSNEETQNVKKKEDNNVWAEVFVEDEEKWISVDVPRQKIHCVNELYVSLYS